MLELNGLTYSTGSFQLTYLFLFVLMVISAGVMYLYVKN